MGKMVDIQFVHESLMDEIKGFTLLFFPSSLIHKIFHRMQQKTLKGNVIQVFEVVKNGEMVIIEYPKQILEGNVSHNSIKDDTP